MVVLYGESGFKVIDYLSNKITCLSRRWTLFACVCCVPWAEFQKQEKAKEAVSHFLVILLESRATAVQ